MEEFITEISQIKYEENPVIKFQGTISEIINKGDGEKKPFKLLVKMEASGENVSVFSWKWSLLDIAEQGVSSLNVFNLTGTASLYKGEPQIRLDNLSDAGIQSTRKKIQELKIDTYKAGIETLIKTYVPTSSVYRKFLDDLIINNEKFWKWPAASKMHHAFPGGLAKHSFNVCNNAIAIWKTYEGQNLNIEAIVTGALLHDIGKLTEYNESGGRTIYGDLIGHIVSGVEKIILKSLEYGLDPERKTEIVILKNIILSHHEKIEWGCPVKPGTLEAFIVARADNLDADIETIEKNLEMTEVNKQTEYMPSNELKSLKWHY